MKCSRKQIPFFILLFIFMMAGYRVAAQEICANSMDDDGDGLIDLQDPDCQCHFNVTGNLLLNASFESYDHCPISYIYDQDYKIANNWEFGTYDAYEAYFYHNLTCSYDSGLLMLNMPPALPLPDGTGFISIHNSAYLHPIPEKDMTKTYVGQCLQSPLKAGEDYTLSFYAGRFRSWDNLTGKIFPFTVAVFGNADCNAVPFGKPYAAGNGCPSNYAGWQLLGKTTLYSNGQWVQSKINLKIPRDIHVIEVGVDCAILPPIVDLTDSTTYLDYHVYYLDDLHLLPTKDFHFEYIQAKTGIACNGLPVLLAPAVANATYQWYRDSIAIAGAAGDTYQVADVTTPHFYNVLITTAQECIISEPFLVTASNLDAIRIPADTILCMNDTLMLSPPFDGISYTINGRMSDEVVISSEGNYSITATDINGCQKTFSTHVVQQNCTDCDAYIPSAFTPNGDGLNDLFKPKINCAVKEYHLSIFNRWGERIFISRDINKGWDGTYLGKKLSSGGYIYSIDYRNSSGVFKSARGMIVLVM